jgi:hypothetical protein
MLAKFMRHKIWKYSANMLLQFPGPIMLPLFPKRSNLCHNFHEYDVRTYAAGWRQILGEDTNCALPWDIPQKFEEVKAETSVPVESINVDSPRNN